MVDDKSILASENDVIFDKILQSRPQESSDKNDFEKKLSDPLIDEKIKKNQNKINFNSLKPKQSLKIDQQDQIPEENETDIDIEQEKKNPLNILNKKEVEFCFKLIKLGTFIEQK